MDTQQLHSFIMVAQYLNFTEAAKRLYIGQSALSKQIADFEKELGFKLFIRRHHSLELTAAGKLLLKEGKNFIAQFSEIIEKARQAQYGIRGSLKIGCFGIENTFLPYSIRKFHDLYSQVSLDISVLTLKMLKEALEREELDLGFFPLLGNDCKSDGFKQHLVCRLPLYFLLPGSHPCANKNAVDISALAKDPFIIISETECPEGFNWFINFCKIRGFVPNIYSKSARLESILWQVEAGLGVSFIPKVPALMRSISPNTSLVYMQGEDACLNIAALWKKEHHNPATPLYLKVLETMNQQLSSDVQHSVQSNACSP